MAESTGQTGEVKVPREPLKMKPDGSIQGLGEALNQMGVFTNAQEEKAATEATADAPESISAPDEKVQPLEVTPPTGAQEVKLKIKWQGQEIELPEKDLVSLAQQGYDYTKKTQALAEKERNLAPLEGIAKQIQSDPRFAAHVYQYFQQVPTVVAEKVPENPVERLKYEIRQEIMKEITPFVQQSVAPVTQQQAINRVVMDVMKDPMYNEVQNKLHEYVQALPPHSRQLEFLRLDQDPQSYAEMYGHLREQLVKQKAVPVASTTTMPPKDTNRGVRAPLLEASGPSEPPAPKDAQKKDRLSKAKAKLLAKGDTGALADWIRESGISDILKGPSPR